MKVFFGILLIFSSFGFGQERKNIEFLDNWTNDSILTSSTKVRYNECWGFEINGTEYAVLGSTEGTHFFEISKTGKFIFIDFVKGRYSSAQVVHRDYKTYHNYLYAVCDEGNSSLQIIDLTYLPDSVHVVYDQTDKIQRAHNLFIDEPNKLLYAFSVITLDSPSPPTTDAMKVFSLENPENPTLLYAGPTDIPEVHDGYVRDNIAILNCGFDGLRRYDFSDPTSPTFLQLIPFYQEQGYNHQGWLNPSGDTYIFADETTGKKLKKCSVLSDGEIQIDSYFGIGISEGSIPHNIMLDEQFAYVAYYNFGLRVFDYTSTPIEQVAFYDTYPEDASFQMNGAWGVYSKLPSGRIIVSDRMHGLFLFEFDKKTFSKRSNDSFQIYPNPISSGEELTFFLDSNFEGPLDFDIFDSNGKRIQSGSKSDFNFLNIPINQAAGVYILRVRYEKNLEFIEIEKPIVVR